MRGQQRFPARRDAKRVDIAQVQMPAIVTGKPAQIAVQVTGKGTLGLKWVLMDTSAETLVQAGEAQPGPGGSFRISLDAQTMARVKPGLYKLSLAGYSDALISLSERDVDFRVGA